jgi:AbrB family looped-hinge helix DNA binding protein
MTTISSKNQITLPIHLLRELGLGPGDRLAITREGNRLLLRPRPRDWVAYYAGSLKGVYGKDKAEIGAYVADVRDAEEREAAQERAWSGH